MTNRFCVTHAIVLSALLTAPLARAEYEYRTIDEYIVRHEYGKAERALQQIAAAGETEAMYRLAGLYRGGQGFPRRLDESARLYTRAAEKGHVDSMYLAGQCYDRGIGVPKDAAIARRWYEVAAAHGDARARDRLTTLHDSEVDLFDAVASAGDSPAVLQRLQTADLAMLDRQDRTLLMIAAGAGAATAVDALLARGMPAEGALDRTGRSALFHGVESGNTAVVSALLAAGADPNRSDAAGNAPLHLAAAAGSMAMVDALLAAGARADAQTRGQWTAFDIASNKGHEQVAARLAGLVGKRTLVAKTTTAQQIDVLRKGERFKGMSDLAVAVWDGDEALVASLLAAGAKDTRGPDGHGALYCAIDRDRPKILDMLLAAGRNPNDETGPAGSLLHVAIDRGQSATAERLLRAGIDETVTNQHGETALLHALAKGDRETAARLVHAHAPVERADESGSTPLMAAARLGDTNMISELLQNGAKATSFDRRERSALWYAAGVAEPAAIEKLLAAGAGFEADSEGVTPLHRAIAIHRLGSVERLLAAHHPVDGRTRSGSSPLMLAASQGDADIVAALLAHGADVNQRDDAGDTALHKAAAFDHLAVARALLDAGAKPGVRNDKNLNFFDLAARNEDAGWLALAESHRSQIAKILGG